MAANVSVKVRTPTVPNHLHLELDGRERGVTVPLSALDEDQLEAVGVAWTEALLARREEQLAEEE